ncbi:two-component sensor histidine kinase [Shewanella sp. c952]|uniref:sensor histidine kinase n=1 Tax=Shewanella sp. c952 TaxID=2815913 RepID=UPI001BB9AC74|nr:HAMP domain-containing sensor histidine kinase [Shewanella sp. c952]GIU03315.1 two-component sensor histidine kinase [Shewanella sp. c952]
MRSLFSRILLAATLVIFILFIALWQWLQFSQEFSRNQIQQSLHRELAEHMAHINPLLSKGITSDAALKEAFHDFMLLGPSFEIYTLDNQGQVIAYDAKEEKIKQHRVDTNTIEQFIQGVNLPILGTDPRSEQKDKIFSAAKLLTPSGQQTGYLYVIIGGEDFDSWQTIVSDHQAPQFWTTAILIAIGFAIILFILLLKLFTAPLSRLENDLRLVAAQQLNSGVTLPGQYTGSSEINQLSKHINTLLQALSLQHQAINRQQEERHEFMLHLSHDLKTPLTSLQGYIDTWLLLPPHERSSDLIEIAANSSQHLQQLLGQMLELAALENGQVKPQWQEIQLQEVLDELQQTFDPRANGKRIILDFEDTLSLYINTDRQLLLRILNNLVDNAIRYTPEQGVISIKTIADKSSGTTWLQVSDNGSGMHKHELAALKQMTQKPMAMTAKQSALPQLGVGLAIVRQLLAILKCDIQIDSQPGKGSRFRIELQIRPLLIDEQGSADKPLSAEDGFENSVHQG